MRLSTFAFAAAAACAAANGTASAQSVTYLDQGWSPNQRAHFYFTPQGSRMMPADWFAALERADGQGRFGDPAHLRRFGFITDDTDSTHNPGGYPIGFAIDPVSQHIGLTCSACHTANVQVGDTTLRIDGAPAHLDFDSFYQSLAQAVSLTLLDPDRFTRFATSLGATDETATKALQQGLAAFDLALTGDATLRRATIASGFGRVDALTQIVNALAVRNQQLPINLFPVSSPTSYPPLWLAPDLEFVQWNPIASSPIGRNGGEVLGVFGGTTIGPDAGAAAFSSTLLVQQLHDLETWLQHLEPPAWDEALMGAIDTELAAEGADLFRSNCAKCHNMAPYARTLPENNHFGKTFIRIGRVDFRDVGTDPAYVRDLVTRRIATNATTAPLFGGAPIVPAPTFFAGVVGATLRRAMADAGLSDEQIVEFNGFRFRTGPDGAPVPYEPPSATDLKASPLAGVWATGPYLHNGSVPTVYDMLSPPDERPAVFWTGGKTLDLQNLGYNSAEAPGLFRFDTSLPGNGNGGHAYPRTGLTHDERMAVIEYLKTQ